MNCLTVKVLLGAAGFRMSNVAPIKDPDSQSFWRLATRDSESV